ncbi:hypothetical protein GCM10023208_24530 [Erythrobacter westpacificensis]|uniref:Uncharacterized protein n=1 Tax=Erythrobacter westpacificensis TaxID=1055231 RepID=A0ABP9KGG8_9SPHN
MAEKKVSEEVNPAIARYWQYRAAQSAHDALSYEKALEDATIPDEQIDPLFDRRAETFRDLMFAPADDLNALRDKMKAFTIEDAHEDVNAREIIQVLFADVERIREKLGNEERRRERGA